MYLTKIFIVIWTVGVSWDYNRVQYAVYINTLSYIFTTKKYCHEMSQNYLHKFFE